MSSRSNPSLDLLVPVLDGDVPARWPIWGSPLEEHVSAFYTTGRYIPTDYQSLGVQLVVPLQDEKKLHQRSTAEWKGVIGVLVDANGSEDDRKKAADRVIAVCNAVAPATDAWYRKLRFRIGLLLSEEPLETRTYVDYGHTLKLRAESVLGGDVEWQLAYSPQTFLTVLRMFEQQLVYVYRRARAA